VVLSRFELATCRGESAAGQLLIVEGFVRTAKHLSRLIEIRWFDASYILINYRAVFGVQCMEGDVGEVRGTFTVSASRLAYDVLVVRIQRCLTSDSLSFRKLSLLRA
jgi:hypothetical protein